jgi:tetratricopeptide (TPR) repeat protein
MANSAGVPQRIPLGCTGLFHFCEPGAGQLWRDKCYTTRMPAKPLLRYISPLIAALLCALFLTACNRDPGVRKQKFYNNAVEYLKKGQVKRAEIELFNALKIDPNFVEANNILAEIFAQQGKFPEAYTLLQRAVAARPDYLPSRRGLSQIYRMGGKFAEAETEATYILERSPDDIDALLSLGTAQRAQKKLKESEGTFNRVLEIQPGQVNAYLALAAIKQEAKDIPAAERFLKLAYANNPRSVTVFLGLVKFYVTTGRPEAAEPLFAEALKVSNNNVTILQAQADYYLGQKDLVKGEEAARKMGSTRPNDPKYWGVLADFYIQTDNWTKARAELEASLKQHKDDPGLLRKLIEVCLHLNDRQTAEALNEALSKKQPTDPYVSLVKGRLYLAHGDVESALERFNQTQKYQPDLPSLYYWYAQAYIQKGQLGQAKQALDTALKLDPNYREARLRLAELQNRTNGWDAALSNAKMLLVRNPRDGAAMLVYSQALLFKKEFDQAEKVLKLNAEHNPKNTEAHVQWGIVDLAHKNLPAAATEFMQAWELDPGSKPLLENVLLGFVTRKQPDAAIEFLRKAIHDRPQLALLYHELAQVYLLQDKRPLAIAALKKALELAPASADSAVLLADIYTAGKEPEQANQVLAGILKRDPKNVDLMIHAGMIFEKLQKWDEARGAYERALLIDTANAVAKNNLASILLEHGGNIDQALKLAQEAKETLPDNLKVTSTIGWVYYKKGIYSTAKDYLKECADKDKQNATYQFQLGMTYLKLGNREEAARSLRSALKLAPNFLDAPAAREALAQL